jgi:hypothetical protein
MKINVESLLKEMTYGAEYRFLECGKDDEELQKIAGKRGIKLPAIDLSIFKCKFAFTNRTNLNGCSLPEDEVKKSLDTLAGKAIDFDHLRERIVGHWLDATLEGDTMYAYGAFFKGNLADDFETIKDLMDKKNLAISFEAYGNREFRKDGTYDLKDIEFAGGALLITTKPAFPGAGVIEMANTKVLEFAKAMTEPKQYVYGIERKKMEEAKKLKVEKARMYTFDMETIMRLTGEIICPVCGCQGCVDVDEIDFKENQLCCTCFGCGAELCVDLSPKASVEQPEVARKVVSIKVKEKTMSKVEEKAEESIKTDATAETVTPPATSSEELIKTEGEDEAPVDETAGKCGGKGKGVKKSAKASEELIKTEDESAEDVEEADAGEDEAEETTEAATAPVAESAKVAELEKENATLKDQLTKARAEGKMIGERRSSLGEFASELSDDDLLDAVKFENASLKKQIAELKGGKISTETASVKVDAALEIGSKDKKAKSEVSTLAEGVAKQAWK